jgi:hypothetical protein
MEGSGQVLKFGGMSAGSAEGLSACGRAGRVVPEAPGL